jgi:hypothetical protein
LNYYNTQILCREVLLPFDNGFNGDEIFPVRLDMAYSSDFNDPEIISRMYYYYYDYFDNYEFIKVLDVPAKVILQNWNSEKLRWEDSQVKEYFISPSDFEIAVTELRAESGFSIYPNPAKDQLYINLPVNLAQKFADCVVKINDFSGRTVLEVSYNGTGPLDISSLESGIFLLSVRTDNQIYSERFIKY